MSARAAEAVRDHSRATGTDRTLLFVLATYIYPPQVDECWPAVDTLARGVGVSARQVQAITARLAQQGELIVIPGGGRNRTNRYRLTCVQKLTETLQATAGYQGAEQPETLHATAGFRGETLQRTAGYQTGNTPLSPAGFTPEQHETLRQPAGFAPETLQHTAPEVIGAHKQQNEQSVRTTDVLRGSARAVFYPPIVTERDQQRAAIEAAADLRAREGFDLAWRDWLEYKGAALYGRPIAVRRALDFLRAQPDPVEVLTYALRNGRDTLTPKPIPAFNPTPTRQFTPRPQTVAEANSRAAAGAEDLYLRLQERKDDTVF